MFYKFDDEAELPPQPDKRPSPFPNENVDKVEEQTVAGYSKTAHFFRGFMKAASAR